VVALQAAGGGFALKTDPAGVSAESGRLAAMLNGYQKTCILIAGVKLGLFGALADGPSSEESLARRLGAHPPSLSRFVSALRVLGVLQGDGERVALTALGRHLLAPGLAAWTHLIAEEYLPAWSKLHESVVTGRPAFETIFGMNPWEHRERNPHLNESFNRLAADVQGPVLATLRDNWDFSSTRCLADIGGGAGYFLAGVLQAYPALHGVLFDQPHVVTSAAAVLDAAGVRDRCRLIGGSFFEALPSGADVLVLKLILHDWDDERCVLLLRRCREAMTPGSTLLVMENLLAAHDASVSERTVMLDLHMMTMLGGQERSLEQYESLFEAAGLHLVRSVGRGAQLAILEVAPRPHA
jgi:hypothetical protein